MGAERVAESEVEEVQGKVGIVSKLEDNLGNFIGVEAIGEETAEVGPSGFGAVVLKYGDSGCDGGFIGRRRWSSEGRERQRFVQRGRKEDSFSDNS